MMSRQFVPQTSKKKRLRIGIAILVCVLLFAVPPIRSGVRTVVSSIGMSIARGTHGVGGWFSGIATTIRSKHSLEAENTMLQTQIDELNTRLTAYNALASENADLKTILNRTDGISFTLASVIEKPPHSIYDSLIIDGGAKIGFKAGQIVFANGATPIGIITEVRPSSALVQLYSAPRQEFEARLSIPNAGAGSNIDVTLVGRGGGNFIATIPHDIQIAEGTTVVTKEIHPYVVAVFQKITSDPRDPFQSLLLSAPVNINELSFVEVRQSDSKAETPKSAGN